LVGIGLKVVLAGALGFGLRRRGFVSGQLAQDLGRLLLSVIAPFAILAAASRPYTPELGKSLLTVAGLSAGYFLLAIAGGWALSRVLPLDANAKRAFTCLVAFPNVTFIGLPIITELFGTPGLLCGVVVNLFFNLMFYTFAEHHMGTKGRFDWRAVVKSPVVWACVLAIVVFLARIPVPQVVTDALTMIGAAMAPIAMMIVGFGLADSYLGDLIKNPYGYLVNLFRLAIWPVAILAVSRLLGLDPLAANAAAVLFGLPAGTMTVVLAARNRVAYQFAAQTVVQSNVLMFLTVPLLYLLVTTWQ
jgi:predicted permease